MSNVFDDIYKKRLNLDFRNLNMGTKASLNINEEATLKVEELSDTILDTLFINLYNKFDSDEVPKYSKDEVNIIDEKIKRNRKEADSLRDQLKKIKEDIVEDVKGKTYTLDISKSTTLKKASNNIFGGNKQSITYEDYLVLLEMKQQIIINESSDILSEE